MKKIENKKIFILGFARSGYEVAKLLSGQNNEIIITDMKDQDEDKIKELEDLGIKFIKSDKQDELLDDTFDLVIKNPGVKLDNPTVLKASELGIKLTNELEIAYNYLPDNVKIIGITGSNGKTTTTTLTYEILKIANLPVHLGGNIGIPMSNLVKDVKENDILVLEISGHQLHDFYEFKTDISVLTNLYEVHIDHFGSFENYKYNKCRIFDHHTKDNLAIINKTNKDAYNDTLNIPDKKLYFSAYENADLCIKDNYINYNGEDIIKLDDIKIKGKHNYENIMCAIAVAKEFNVSNEVIFNVLNNFKGVEHRIEYVDTKNGISFYNDSKSTNVTATQTALSAFTNPVVLLLGGLDRGHSFEDLKTYLTHVKYIVSFGETKNRIYDFACENNINCEVVDTLEEATKFAYSVAEEGDTVLLSPACASWDQYDNFEIRGNEFKQIIKNL